MTHSNATSNLQGNQGSDYTPGSMEVHRHIGKLEGQLKQVDDRQNRFEVRIGDEIKELHDKIDVNFLQLSDQVKTLNTSIIQSQFIGKGAWKAITAIGAVIAFVITTTILIAGQYISYYEIQVETNPPGSIKDE